jgi:hypothetical protein
MDPRGVRAIVQSLPALAVVRAHLSYPLWRSHFGGARAALRWFAHLVRAVTASLCSCQRHYITVKRLDEADATGVPTWMAADRETECLVLDSPKALRALAPEIPAGFRDSVGALHTRLAHGCVVCVARRPRKDGAGKEVVGYEIAERGVFAALGRRTPLSRDVVLSHHAEVLPAYRGQHIHRLLGATRDAYFRRRAGRIVCRVVAADDRASLQALGRAGHTVVGTVTRITALRGLVLWQTPMERIERVLRLEGGTRARRSSSAA